MLPRSLQISGWVFLIAGVAALTLHADPSKSITLKWYGQSFFQLTCADGTKLVFDPHAIPEYNRPMVSADWVLISHLHDDHTQVESLDQPEKLKDKVLYGLNPKDRGRTWNDIDQKVGANRVYNVPSFHDGYKGMKRGKNSIFVIETGGLKVVHLGDLGHSLEPEQIREIGTPDILLIPVGGIYTINGEEAKGIIKQLKPRLYVIPMHHATKVYDSLQPTDEFLEGQKNVRKIDSNTLTIPLDMKADQPTTVILGFADK
jgi:L-ascorbate metabolism protein UlaG (beta-lactamase superfamily)